MSCCSRSDQAAVSIEAVKKLLRLLRRRTLPVGRSCWRASMDRTTRSWCTEGRGRRIVVVRLGRGDALRSQCYASSPYLAGLFPGHKLERLASPLEPFTIATRTAVLGRQGRAKSLPISKLGAGSTDRPDHVVQCVPCARAKGYHRGLIPSTALARAWHCTQPSVPGRSFSFSAP